MEDQPVMDLPIMNQQVMDLQVLCQKVIDQPVIDQQVMKQAIEHIAIDKEVLDQMTADQIDDQMLMEAQVMKHLVKSPGQLITVKTNNGIFYPEASCPLILLEANIKNTKGLIIRYLIDALIERSYKGIEYLIYQHDDEIFEDASEAADKFIDEYDENYLTTIMMNLLFE